MAPYAGALYEIITFSAVSLYDRMKKLFDIISYHESNEKSFFEIIV